MENRPGLIFVEHADAGSLGHRGLDRSIIINDLALFELLWGKRHVIIVVEVAAERRHPIEAPTHPLLKYRQLRDWRPRDRDQDDIALVQMDQHPVEVIGPERAARARFLPARIKHQMVDDQLLSSG